MYLVNFASGMKEKRYERRLIRHLGEFNHLYGKYSISRKSIPEGVVPKWSEGDTMKRDTRNNVPLSRVGLLLKIAAGFQLPTTYAECDTREAHYFTTAARPEPCSCQLLLTWCCPLDHLHPRMHGCSFAGYFRQPSSSRHACNARHAQKLHHK